MPSEAQKSADALRTQIAELQKQLTDVVEQERKDDLEMMKILQRKHNFTQRDLGNLFKPRKRGSGSGA